MADATQPPAGPLNSVGSRHDWRSLDRYKTLAVNYVLKLHGAGVVFNYHISEITPDIDIAYFGGHLGLRGGVAVSFEKVLAVHPSTLDVRVVSYSYSCHVRGMGNVFRYDNSHGRTRDDDDPSNQLVTWHHQHVWPEPSKDERKAKRVWIGDPDWGKSGQFPANDWPHLDEVVWEAENWRQAHSGRLRLNEEPTRVAGLRLDAAYGLHDD